MSWLGGLRVSLGRLVSIVVLPAIILSLLPLSLERRLVLGPRLARIWGRMMLAFCGIRLRLTPAARDVLENRAPRVLTLNHSSTLDLFAGGAFYPEGCVTIAKAELRKVPLLGPATVLLGMVYIDRSDAGSARASLHAAAARVVAERLVVLISPEGTRNKTPGLLPFKTGAFELAAAAGVPVVPLVWHGCRELWPMGAVGPWPGEVVVDALEPLTVDKDADRAALRAVADRLRERYEVALAAGPPTRGRALF
ncbi:MAG: 1-acyl-sn-glycerol-3-phosphate acyltransferase [Deltaproteobacteria bacterium]|nr:1-acyl-sn-glycerol-3-phosphate acyltransferase [Deltaproteobacteria bacterium]